MTLNSKDLILGENNELRCLDGAPIAAGQFQLAPMNCAYLVI